VLVNFWATWCPPCRAETPGLVRLANEYRSQGLEVVGISLDEDTGAIRPFIDDYQIPYPILLPSDQANLPLLVEVLPTTLLYDRQGRMAKRYVGGVAESIFKADVERLLAER
jgi:cytochrome c biogenesis protein CcmG, thiol:disulfide interchange protein DsbE